MYRIWNIHLQIYKTVDFQNLTRATGGTERCFFFSVQGCYYLRSVASLLLWNICTTGTCHGGCQGLRCPGIHRFWSPNFHCFHIAGDGHQPASQQSFKAESWKLEKKPWNHPSEISWNNCKVLVSKSVFVRFLFDTRKMGESRPYWTTFMFCNLKPPNFIDAFNVKYMTRQTYRVPRSEAGKCGAALPGGTWEGAGGWQWCRLGQGESLVNMSDSTV